MFNITVLVLSRVSKKRGLRPGVTATWGVERDPLMLLVLFTIEMLA